MSNDDMEARGKTEPDATDERIPKSDAGQIEIGVSTQECAHLGL